jgi:hypothetical protein
MTFLELEILIFGLLGIGIKVYQVFLKESANRINRKI